MSQADDEAERDLMALQFAHQVLERISNNSFPRRDEGHILDYRPGTIKDAQRHATVALERLTPTLCRMLAADAESRQASETADRAEQWRQAALAFERRAMRVEAGVRGLLASMDGGFIQADFQAKLIGTKREFNDAVDHLSTLVGFDSPRAGAPQEGRNDSASQENLPPHASDVSSREKGRHT